MSCSSVQFISSNSLPVDMNYAKGDTTEVSVEVSKDFYLWGKYPEIQKIEVDKIFAMEGFTKVSDLRINEIHTTKKAMWMFFTFGMYYPQSFKLIASTN